MPTKKAVKKPANTPKSVGNSPGLSINPVPSMAKFRTKDKTLVATGYEKVQQDEDGVYRVYFTALQMYPRNLVLVEHGSRIFDLESLLRNSASHVVYAAGIANFRIALPCAVTSRCFSVGDRPTQELVRSTW